MNRVHAAELLRTAAKHPNYGDENILKFEKAITVALGTDFVQDYLEASDGSMDAARRIMMRLQHASEDRDEQMIRASIQYNGVTWYVQIDQGGARYSGLQTESPSQAILTACMEWACANAHREANAMGDEDE